MSERRRRFATVSGLVSVVVLMVGLAYASVPLYDLFCRVTGFGGTTQISKNPPKIPPGPLRTPPDPGPTGPGEKGWPGLALNI